MMIYSISFIEEFGSSFENRSGWHGLKGQEPPKGEVAAALAKNDFYVFCGHGTSEKYFTVRFEDQFCPS